MKAYAILRAAPVAIFALSPFQYTNAAIPSEGALTNGSFESDYLGWVTSGNQGIYSPPLYRATHGNKLVAFNAGNSTPNAVLSQTFTTVVGEAVSIEFDAGVIAYNRSSQTLQVTVTGAGDLVSKTITLTGQGAGSNIWASQSFAFVADATRTTLTFRDLSTTTTAIDLLLDHIRITPVVSGSNTPPVAVADSYTVIQDTALVIPAGGLLSNDSDADSNTLSAVIEIGPGKGSITPIINGGFTYIPMIGFVGVDTFTYHANDGTENSNTATVVIQVDPISSSRIINGSFENNLEAWTKVGNLEVRTGTPYTATHGTKIIAFNVSQSAPNGTLSQSFPTVAGKSYTLQFDVGVLAYNTNDQALGITVTGAGNILSKSLAMNGLGGGFNHWLPQIFTFVANSSSTSLAFRDQSLSTDAIDLLLDNIRVTETVVGPNTAPVANDDTYTAGQDTTLIVSARGILTNDSDAQADPLTAIFGTGPEHGSVLVNPDGGFTYTPAQGYTGEDQFTYYANDGGLDSNRATVKIHVVAIVSGVSFPTIAGNKFIARFHVVPNDAETSVPVLRLTIEGNSALKNVELSTPLPTGARAVPYSILFLADSGITTIRFTLANGDLAEPGRIVGLKVAEPLTLAPSMEPNPRQQAQIDRKYGLFLHYGINTFHDVEWSDGTKPASSYQPTALDVEQWIKTACEAGMRYVLIISKHHDGFCLWDSPWTSYDVGSSPVTTNIIAAAGAACRKYGIGMGLYYSVWDRHEPTYGNDSSYNQFLLRQIEELLANNGTICELWLDGAWDKPNSSWPCVELYDLVRRLQPECQVSFNGTIGKPWSPDTNATPDSQQEGFPIRYFPSDFRLSDPLFAKTPDPKLFSSQDRLFYLPFEATTMLSGYSNWFYHTTDRYNRSVSELAAIYESATAQNNILVLNAPPDRSGQVRDIERSTLFQLRDRVGLKSRLSLPYQSITPIVPARIQAEDFDIGGPEVAYMDLTPLNSNGQYRPGESVDIARTTDEGGGFHVVATAGGEWLKYTFKAIEEGSYLMSLRVANPNAGGRIFFELDGIDISGVISVPNTGSFDTWQTISVPNVFISKGEHVLRLVTGEGGPSGIAGAFNWLSFISAPLPGPTADAGRDFEVLDSGNQGFGEVLLDGSASIAGDNPIVAFEWMEDGLVLASGINPSIRIATGTHLIRLVVTDENGVSDWDEIQVTVSPAGLVNGSFEYGYHGWEVSGNQGIESLPPYVPSNGMSLVAFNSRELQPNGILSQSFATIPGQNYSLKFDAGVLSYNFSSQTLQVVISGTGELISKTITLAGSAGGVTRWVSHVVSFKADSMNTILAFRDRSAVTGAIDLLLDNVSVVADAGNPNTNPVGISDSYVTNRNTAITVSDPGVLANDVDAESSILNAVMVTYPSHGSIKLRVGGGFVYTPAADYSGTDVFTYQASDGVLKSGIVSVVITVNNLPSSHLNNGGFESGTSGWTLSGNVDIRSSSPYQATEGSQLVAFNSGNRPCNGSLAQSFSTTAGLVYTLEFDVGVLAYNSNSQMMKVTANGIGSLLSETIVVSGVGSGVNRWLPRDYTFVADSGTTVLAFWDLSTATIGLDLLLDHVRVTISSVNAGANGQPLSSADEAPVLDSMPSSVPLPPLPSLPSPTLSGGPGNVTLRMEAPMTGRYILQRSMDLVFWEFVGEAVFEAFETIEFHDSHLLPVENPNEIKSFYRIGFTRD